MSAISTCASRCRSKEGAPCATTLTSKLLGSMTRRELLIAMQLLAHAVHAFEEAHNKDGAGGGVVEIHEEHR